MYNEGGYQAKTRGRESCLRREKAKTLAEGDKPINVGDFPGNAEVDNTTRKTERGRGLDPIMWKSLEIQGK